MLRILFVDDEQNILDSLRRMAHKKRNEWEAAFAISGETALELMDKANFDIVVSDMRMPSMDGADLLKSLAQRHPNALRFILSGHSDKALILKAIPWTHQFIAKPCDSETLQQKILSSLALKDLLSNPILHRRLSSIKTLPSLPATYTQLCAELQSEEGTIRSAAKIIESDVSLTAKILQLVNSAFFSLPRHIQSLEQAVGLLGLETIRTLTLMTGVFSNSSISNSNLLPVTNLFDHSASVSACAKKIAQLFNLENNDIEDSFFAGALHDVGKLVILRNFRKELDEIEQLTIQDNYSPIDAELACLGVTHAIIGAHLLAIWGIPHSIIKAVAHHHTPFETGDIELSPSIIVYLSDELVHAHSSNKSFEEFRDKLDLDNLSRVDINGKLEDMYKIGLETVYTEERGR